MNSEQNWQHLSQCNFQSVSFIHYKCDACSENIATALGRSISKILITYSVQVIRIDKYGTV